MGLKTASLALVFTIACAALLEAQGVPTQQELRRLLANPQAGEAIRQRLLGSGLTPDQIRSRLQAAGLPTNALDSYIRAQTGGQLTPSDTVLQALGAPEREH